MCRFPVVVSLGGNKQLSGGIMFFRQDSGGVKLCRENNSDKVAVVEGYFTWRWLRVLVAEGYGGKGFGGGGSTVVGSRSWWGFDGRGRCRYSGGCGAVVVVEDEAILIWLRLGCKVDNHIDLVEIEGLPKIVSTFKLF
ncbi:hypothetical protein Tco_0329176 [Tanacetum coccineum]